MNFSPYPLLLLVGVAVTLTMWMRLAKRDERLLVIYIAALASAFCGAKLVYLAAEGWMFWHDPHRWLIWATGKTILGALLGGYLGVEVAKKTLHYERTTGDFFAIVAPVGVFIGRIGCLLHGCCLGRECDPAWWTIRDRFGVDRWPAVPVEMAFNLFALGGVLLLRKFRLFTGQHFHLYLIAYGLFRFVHERMRDTFRLAWGFTGYQFAALAVALLGIWGYYSRRWQKARGMLE